MADVATLERAAHRGEGERRVPDRTSSTMATRAYRSGSSRRARRARAGARSAGCRRRGSRGPRTASAAAVLPPPDSPLRRTTCGAAVEGGRRARRRSRPSAPCGNRRLDTALAGAMAASLPRCPGRLRRGSVGLCGEARSATLRAMTRIEISNRDVHRQAEDGRAHEVAAGRITVAKTAIPRITYRRASSAGGGRHDPIRDRM